MAKFNHASAASSKITDLENRIKAINDRLDNGITSVTVDGITHMVSLDIQRQRRNELLRELEQARAEAEGRTTNTSCFRPVRF